MKEQVRRWFNPVILCTLSLVSGGWVLQRSGGGRTVAEEARLFAQVLRHVAQNFVDHTTPQALYTKAIGGILAELGDPYTSLSGRVSGKR